MYFSSLIIVGGKAGALICYEVMRRLIPDCRIGFCQNFFDKTILPGASYLQGNIETHLSTFKNYFVATGDNHLRQEITKDIISKTGVVPINIIHDRATVSPSARLGCGNLILCGAVVHTNAMVGNGCIINTNAVVEHDNVIGDYCQISPGATLCGYVTVGDYSFISANATVIPKKKIADNTVVGAGSVVIDDITDEHYLYAGVPAKKKKRYEDQHI